MSGGSFNYLYSKDITELEQDEETWQYMVTELRDRHLNDIANELEAVAERFGDARRRATAQLQKLEGVLKAVEWHVSCDGSQEDVDKAVAKYREARAKGI